MKVPKVKYVEEIVNVEVPEYKIVVRIHIDFDSAVVYSQLDNSWCRRITRLWSALCLRL